MSLQVVESIDRNHDRHVSNAVNELYDRGYIVTDVRRKKRMRLIAFDTDVTHVHYRTKVDMTDHSEMTTASDKRLVDILKQLNYDKR